MTDVKTSPGFLHLHALNGGGEWLHMCIKHRETSAYLMEVAMLDATVATSAAGTFYRIGLQAGDVGVRSIQTYQQSATWTSGQLNLVLYRVIAAAPILAAGVPAPLDWVSGGGPRIYNDSCLFFIFVPSTTTTTLISGWSQETSG